MRCSSGFSPPQSSAVRSPEKTRCRLTTPDDVSGAKRTFRRGPTNSSVLAVFLPPVRFTNRLCASCLRKGDYLSSLNPETEKAPCVVIIEGQHPEEDNTPRHRGTAATKAKTVTPSRHKTPFPLFITPLCFRFHVVWVMCPCACAVGFSY